MSNEAREGGWGSGVWSSVPISTVQHYEDTKYMKNILQDKSMTPDLSYCSSLILLDRAGTARSGAGSGGAHLAENVCLKVQMKLLE